MNEEGKALFNFTFDERCKHRMEFADYLHDYIINCQIYSFSNTRIFQAYDAFQRKLMEGGMKDGETIAITERKKPVVEIKKSGETIELKFKAGKKWVELKIPLDMIKFADWSLYT